ncbi:MAG: amidohydrolase family protein [bacterium]|nr:amidohydrolase family protein [bacterium]
MILFDNCRFLIATPDPEGIIEGGWVLVDGPLIVSVGGLEESPKDEVVKQGGEVVDCSERLVMPGLIDSHNHLANYAFNLLPGIDPSSLEFSGISECLEKFIWPAYTWASDESTHDMTLLAMCNAIKHGTTTITSAFPFPHGTFRAGVASGMRLIMHPQTVSNVILGDALDDDGYLALTEEVIQNYHNAEDGRIQVAVHPHTTYSCSERLLLGSMGLAERYDVGFATHLLESAADRHMSDAQFAAWGGIVGYFQERGLLQERTLFFHCDQVNPREAEIFAEAGVAISHNPQSNATYHGSVADVPALRAAGVTLGLGTDMPAGNLFDNIYTAYLVNAVIPPDQEGQFEPWVPIELATIGSARAQRLGDKIGTIEAGKRADIITVDLHRNTTLYPLNAGNLLYWIVTKCAGTLVEDTMVDGRFLLRGGEFTFLDEEAIIARSDEWMTSFGSWYRARKAAGEPVTVRKYPDYENR